MGEMLKNSKFVVLSVGLDRLQKCSIRCGPGWCARAGDRNLRVKLCCRVCLCAWAIHSLLRRGSGELEVHRTHQSVLMAKVPRDKSDDPCAVAVSRCRRAVSVEGVRKPRERCHAEYMHAMWFCRRLPRDTSGV